MLSSFKVDIVWQIVGDTPNDKPGVTFLWCPLGIGLEVAVSRRRHAFLGKRFPWPGRESSRASREKRREYDVPGAGQTGCG